MLMDAVWVGFKVLYTRNFYGAKSPSFYEINYQNLNMQIFPCAHDVLIPNDWHVTYTPNHWSKEDKMIEYIETIILPYLECKRKELMINQYKLFSTFSKATKQCPELLEENNILVSVPANCTDRLQPIVWIWVSTSLWRSSCNGNSETGISSKFNSSLVKKRRSHQWPSRCLQWSHLMPPACQSIWLHIFKQSDCRKWFQSCQFTTV